MHALELWWFSTHTITEMHAYIYLLLLLSTLANYIDGMRIYDLLYIYIAIFIYTRCGLGLGVSNPRQIVFYVC